MNTRTLGGHASAGNPATPTDDDCPDTLRAAPFGAHYSYTPIDVGFDPRTVGIAVNLPTDAAAITLDDGGAPRRVEGPRARLVEALKAAGYTLAGGAS